MLLMFPAWLEHRVGAFDGAGDRISIAFNATNSYIAA
jgi:putative 2-oxoglutarate-Fe(II)-dependent oxygenase superfamily protein